MRPVCLSMPVAKMWPYEHVGSRYVIFGLTFHLITFSEMCTITLSPPSSLPFPASGSQSKVVHMDNKTSSAMDVISGLNLSHAQTAALVVGLFQEGHGHVHS